MKSLVAAAVVALATTLAQASEHKPVPYASPEGGLYGAGTVHVITGHLSAIVYDFCSLPRCADGKQPLPGLAKMPDGSYLGVTQDGGDDAGGPGGVMFRIAEMDPGQWSPGPPVNICPYWHDCLRFGPPVAFVQAAPNAIEGVSQLADGTKGVRWRIKDYGHGVVGFHPTFFWGNPKEVEEANAQWHLTGNPDEDEIDPDLEAKKPCGIRCTGF